MALQFTENREPAIIIIIIINNYKYDRLKNTDQ